MLKEEIHFFTPLLKGLFAIVIAVFLWEGLQDPSVGLFIGLAACAAIPLLFGKMVIEVKGKGLSVVFGYLKLIKKTIPLSTISSMEAVTYRPLRDFGGWGIRCGRFRSECTNCLSLKGDKGVLLTLVEPVRCCRVNTKRLIIGSQKPELLVEALIQEKK